MELQRQREQEIKRQAETKTVLIEKQVRLPLSIIVSNFAQPFRNPYDTVFDSSWLILLPNFFLMILTLQELALRDMEKSLEIRRKQLEDIAQQQQKNNESYLTRVRSDMQRELEVFELPDHFSQGPSF